MGPAPESAINDVAKLIEKARNPVILLGLMASQPANSAALRKLLEKSRIPVTSTYQAAGAVNQEHFTRFAGRVGLFNNQAGDRLLHLADLIICIGYSPVEYEPSMWNSGDATLVHIDVLPAYEERNYVPDLELVGDIAETLNLLANRIDHKLELSQRASEILVDRQHQRDLLDRRGASSTSLPCIRCASFAPCRTSSITTSRSPWIWAASTSGSPATSTASGRVR